MIQYTDLLQDILNNGVERPDRTNTGTLSVFGRMLRFDLNAGFPLLTLRKIDWKSVVNELLWFISGSTNVNDLPPETQKWWKPWSDENGNLGPIYGQKWRFEGVGSQDIDALGDAIDLIKNDPTSRRILVCSWNVCDLPEMRLPPCHYAFQFYVANGKLSCIVNMRSSDVFIGLPANIASYALLTHMIAQICGLGVGELVMSLADTHLYLNHVDAAKEVLGRYKNLQMHQIRDGRPLMILPTLTLNPDITDIDSFTAGDIHLHNYNPLPHIKVPLAV